MSNIPSHAAERWKRLGKRAELPKLARLHQRRPKGSGPTVKVSLQVCLSLTLRAAATGPGCYAIVVLLLVPRWTYPQIVQTAHSEQRVRVSAKAAVYTSAILEYLTAEVLELADASCALQSPSMHTYTSRDPGNGPNDLRSSVSHVGTYN